MGQPSHYIRRWREHCGISQEELAAEVGRERSYVSRIENGQRKYDQPFLEAAALVLKCQVVELLARDPSDPEGLWTIYDQLTPDQRRQLVDIAKTFPKSTDGSVGGALSLVDAPPKAAKLTSRKPSGRGASSARSK